MRESTHTVPLEGPDPEHPPPERGPGAAAVLAAGGALGLPPELRLSRCVALGEGSAVLGSDSLICQTGSHTLRPGADVGVK